LNGFHDRICKKFKRIVLVSKNIKKTDGR